jgi:hypothetical protein
MALTPRPSTTRGLPWWLSAVVIIGALLTAAGGILALLHPETLLEPGQHMNSAAHLYAGYLVSRNLALAAMLLVMLALQARQVLAGVMVLTALAQAIDGVTDISTARASLVPIVALFAIAFLISAAHLVGHPFWKPNAWRDGAVRR